MIIRGPEYALEDLKENLANADALNDALAFLETLNGKPKTILTDNLLDFVLHDRDGFKPEVHYSNNRGRQWQTMQKTFGETQLAEYGITEASCETSSDKIATIRTLLIATVIQSLEQKYIMQDQDKYDEQLAQFDAASKFMTEEQAAHYAEMIVKVRAPFTRQDKRFADTLDEVIQIVDKTVKERQEFFKTDPIYKHIQELVTVLKTSSLPEQIKSTVLNTAQDARSSKNGLAYDEREEIIKAICDFAKKPNEENRIALHEISVILDRRNSNQNDSIAAISSNLFALSLVSIKSANKSTMYGASQDKKDKGTPAEDLSPKTPKID